MSFYQKQIDFTETVDKETAARIISFVCNDMASGIQNLDTMISVLHKLQYSYFSLSMVEEVDEEGLDKNELRYVNEVCYYSSKLMLDITKLFLLADRVKDRKLQSERQ